MSALARPIPAVFTDLDAPRIMGSNASYIPQEFPGYIVEFCAPRGPYDMQTVRFQFEGGGVVRTAPSCVRIVD